MNTDALFRRANEAYEDGDFALAYALFFEASNHGDHDAMTRLASMHENGEGTSPNILKSIEWDLRAIDAGSTTSALNLGITYKKLGSIHEASRWLEKALDQGDGEAAFELAKLHHLQDMDSPLITKYLNLALEVGNLSESSSEVIQQWLASRDRV